MDDFLKSLSNVADLINLSKRYISALQSHGNGLDFEMDFQFPRNFIFSSG